MGGGPFSLDTLMSLIESKHELVCVYTKPARPSGRGQGIREQEVNKIAKKYNISIRSPVNFKNNDDIKDFKNLYLDVAIVISYGIILPDNILNSTKYGCINVHASILPRWRGSSPIQSAIMNGDKNTGVTIMLMDSGVDTGPILASSKVVIGENEDYLTLSNKLSKLGSNLIIPTMEDFVLGSLSPKRQEEKNETYSKKLIKENFTLDFAVDAVSLERKIRAFSPFPGAKCIVNNENIKVLEAEVENRGQIFSKPGIVLDNNLLVSCKKGAIRFTKIQRPGRKPMKTLEVLNGWRIEKGLKIL